MSISTTKAPFTTSFQTDRRGAPSPQIMNPNPTDSLRGSSLGTLCGDSCCGGCINTNTLHEAMEVLGLRDQNAKHREEWRALRTYIETDLHRLTAAQAALNQTSVINVQNHKVELTQGPYQTGVTISIVDATLLIPREAAKGKTAILNPADAHSPGGSYQTKQGGLEGVYCRSSDLSYALKGQEYPISKQVSDTKNQVPHTENQVLYTKEVTFYKTKNGTLEKPIRVDVMSTAFPDINPKHEGNFKWHYNKEMADDPEKRKAHMRRTLSAALKQAHKNRVKRLILCPIGAGAFGHPPKTVAEVIKEVLTENFPGAFEKVTITMLDDRKTWEGEDRVSEKQKAKSCVIQFREVFGCNA